MQYFIGIVPPEDYLHRILVFQRQWEHNRLPGVVEPHVTLKAQGGLTDDLEWINKVERVCSRFPRFPLTVGEPRFFGNSILYLSMESDALCRLHREIVEAVSPPRELIRHYFEMEDFTPHMTLGKTQYGLTESDLLDMKTAAESVLSPYPTFGVTYVRIYRELQPNRYVPFQEIGLAQR